MQPESTNVDMAHEDTPHDEACGTRILLIEDDPIAARILQSCLAEGRPRYSALIAESWAEAEALGGQHSFDLIATDLNLPDSQGLETVQRCKAFWPGLPLVVISGTEGEGVAAEAMQSGVDDYIVKGELSPRSMKRAVSYALERHRASKDRAVLVQDLEQARKLEAVGQLAAGIAHEINTPAQFVGDNLRFIKESVTDLVKVCQSLQAAVESGKPLEVDALAGLLESADVEYLMEELPLALDQSSGGLEHITRIVRAMKTFSHPSNDAMEPADLNESIRTTIIVASNEWKYVADVTTDLAEDLPLVDCFVGEINQVLLNLVVNAAHAIEECVSDGQMGKITITSTYDDEAVELRVQDTGNGISLEHEDRIFDPFFTTKEVGKGTGQGLSIAYRAVVKNHGGTIRFESLFGQGTTFIVRLPRTAADLKQRAA